MSANEVPNVQLTEVGYVTGFTDGGEPVIDPTNSVVRLQYYGIPVGITVTQTDTGTDLRIELGEDGFTLRLLPGAVLQLGSPFDHLELQDVPDDSSALNGNAAHLLIGVDGDYEAGRLAGIEEGAQLADDKVAQLLTAIVGDIQVYRDLLAEADSEIREFQFWERYADRMIDLAIKQIKQQKRLIKKLKRQCKRAYDEGFRAALTLAPGEGSGTADLEQALINGSQDPEFAAARAEHESSTA